MDVAPLRPGDSGRRCAEADRGARGSAHRGGSVLCPAHGRSGDGSQGDRGRGPAAARGPPQGDPEGARRPEAGRGAFVAGAAAAAAAAARKPEELVTPPPAALKEAAPEPAPVRTEPPPVREAAPEPTPVPVVRAPAPASPRDEVVRGELVGPGPGVVEPELVSTPRVTYPPLARQQRLTGKVVVLVLVNEDGQIGEAKLQQGLASRSGVNEAVVAAVKASRFRAATKNGIPVKMWRTVVIEVKP